LSVTKVFFAVSCNDCLIKYHFVFIVINIVSFILFLVFYIRIAFFVLFCYNCVCARACSISHKLHNYLNDIDIFYFNEMINLHVYVILLDRPVASHWHNHIMWYRVHFAWVGFELTTLGTASIGSCKSNYHKIMITMTPTPIFTTNCKKNFGYTQVCMMSSRNCFSYVLVRVNGGFFVYFCGCQYFILLT
jgi:hypothetical protein